MEETRYKQDFYFRNFSNLMVEAINMDPFMVVPTLSKSLDHFNIETTMVTWGSPMTEANFPGHPCDAKRKLQSVLGMEWF